MNQTVTIDIETASWREDTQVIGLVGLAHSISHFSQLVLPPLFPLLKAEFAVSYAQLGLLMAAFFVVSGIGQALAGFLVDRIGVRPMLFCNRSLGVIGKRILKKLRRTISRPVETLYSLSMPLPLLMGHTEKQLFEKVELAEA